MEYIQTYIRRQDRLLDEKRATELLRTAEYGVLSVTDTGGKPYGIPLNYVWDSDSSLYFHCAPEGRKLRALSAGAEASFCVVGQVQLLPGQFTTRYESLVLEGCASVVTDDAERRHALRLLLGKLSPDHTEVGMEHAEKSFHRVAIIRMDIARWSGKSKKVR